MVARREPRGCVWPTQVWSPSDLDIAADRTLAVSAPDDRSKRRAVTSSPRISWPRLSGSGHAERIVGPRHGRCFAFGAATPRAANMRLVLGEGEVEPRKQKIDALEEPDQLLDLYGLRDHSPIVATFED